MTGQLILWSHALAALLFAAATLAVWRRPRDAGPRVAFATALALSALWALAIAGIGPSDLATRVMEAVRNLAWLGFAFALVRRDRTAGWTLAALCLAVAAVTLSGAGLAVAAAAATVHSGQAELATAHLVFQMMAAAGALVLARHLYGAAPEGGGVQLIAIALALLWSADLLLAVVAYASPAAGEALALMRGIAAAAMALLLGLASQRRAAWTLALSRPATTNALIAVALVGYLGLVACLTALAAAWGGGHARALQAGVVIGAAAALLTLVSTSWLGAWAKVKLAKHLFRHRYDYRVEWQRFTETLASTAEPLERRAVEAVARLLDAQAGLLLTPDGAGLTVAAGWRWEGRSEAGTELLAAYCVETRRIIELDAIRRGEADSDAAAVPGWILAREDAWVLVPLIHGEVLAGLVLLTRAPVARALDWEDFDLLRVAGRQAASFLAEERAGRALAEAQRFDEFNRRFAFILHDIKNLVSQQQLVARNAERHAANPAFRADMVATLRDSADRMTALLARLAHRENGPAEPHDSVDVAGTCERVARRWRVQHPVTVVTAPVWALARSQRLEQVLAHLVQNAVEASAPGAPVTLSAAGDGAQVTIEVADQGAGMAAAFVRDELFRPFASTKAGGFGVGAFEARQLVTAMGGTLSVESREGEGTRFRIVLPAAPPLEAAA
ncbi:MAG: histidine kinase [Sphingomonas bacterium]|uniref:XrtA/PEP-CTERM system histidine kinase PrsK n=1 Tax=Sphingomonas bacterium TaxID=1895847 RepID=UPI00262A289B|nr:XrtA/PEP-CTERM system histidine kinase PrsK [Sphingomonas bacterium]MDB5694682.1 histidine kinase [Sphingomonas bacterium]